MHTKAGGLQANQNKNKTRLLVVDDEVHIRLSLVKALTLVGYAVDEAASGQEALALLQEEPYDLMVLDMVMPGVEGVDVLRRVHQIQPDVSIIILTGNATLESAIAAVKLAAVDYLLKPASIHEIIDAVSNALQKRTASAQKDLLVNVFGEALERFVHSDSSPVLSQLPQMGEARYVVAHSLRLDRAKRMLILDGGQGDTIDLSKGETAVLQCLMQHADQVLSCEQLVRLAWGYETESIEAENVIRPYIFRLRKKLGDDPKKPRLIHTIRKRGYKLALINK